MKIGGRRDHAVLSPQIGACLTMQPAFDFDKVAELFREKL
jgi:hypothetical protein